MPVIDVNLVKGLVTHNGDLFVPESVTEAIGSCVSSSPEDVKREIARLKDVYSSYVELDEPVKVEYHGDATIDAYLVNYLPRNTLIPKLLFLSIVVHPAFQNIPDEIKILDLGSGTGAIVIGFLDLLKNEPFSSIHAKVVCCEISKPSLNRQKELLEKLKFANCEVWHSAMDFTKLETYESNLVKFAPYDFIIAANVLTELPHEHIDALLANMPNILTENGLLLIAEAPRTYTNKLSVHTSKFLREVGLYQFYPCPPGYQCSKEQCWVWFKTDFECPDIEIGGESIPVTNVLKTTWAIYCRSEHSIYDFLYGEDPSLTWGVAAPFGDEFSPKEEMDYEVCTKDGIKIVSHRRKKAWFREKDSVILKGSMLGFNEDYSKVSGWHPLYQLRSRT